MTSYLPDADALLRGEYRFTNPWDMEGCDTPYPLPGGHAYYSPNGDPEWCYMFSRMEFARKLLMAYEQTANPAYIEGYKACVLHFWEENNLSRSRLKPAPTGFVAKGMGRMRAIGRRLFRQRERIATYRTLDTAIRCYTLLTDWATCESLRKDDAYTAALMARMTTDLPFVAADLTPFDRQSNWGLIRLSLYAACQLLLGNTDIQDTLLEIREMLQTQVGPDGGHGECSLMYHMQVLLCLLRLIYRMKQQGLHDPVIAQTATKMTLFAYHLSDPYHRQIPYGDSDITDIDTVMAVAEEVLHLQERVHIDTPTDALLLWEFPPLPSRQDVPLLPKVNRQFLDGIYTVNEENFQLRLFNETTESNHKHADNGGLVLYYKGHPLLIDTGRYSYHHNEKRRHYKGPFGHNIAFLTDIPEWDFRSIWKFSEHPTAICNRATDNGAVVEYTFAQTNITHKRELHLLKQGVAVIDRITCPGYHHLCGHWNVADGIPCNVTDDHLECRVDGERLYGYALPWDGVETSTGRVSPRYNREEIGGTQITLHRAFTDACTAVTLLSAIPGKIEESDTHFSVRVGDEEVLVPKDFNR